MLITRMRAAGETGLITGFAGVLFLYTLG